MNQSRRSQLSTGQQEHSWAPRDFGFMVGVLKPNGQHDYFPTLKQSREDAFCSDLLRSCLVYIWIGKTSVHTDPQEQADGTSLTR